MLKGSLLIPNIRSIFSSPVRMAVDIGGMRKPYRDRKDTFGIGDLVSWTGFD